VIGYPALELRWPPLSACAPKNALFSAIINSFLDMATRKRVDPHVSQHRPTRFAFSSSSRF